MVLSAVGAFSKSFADGAKQSLEPKTIDAGNVLVGSGLSFLRERRFEFFPLSKVGLMLEAGGGTWETGVA